MTEENLVPEPKRMKQGRVAWLIVCLLTSTLIWSFAWNPVMGLLLFTMYPPENLTGIFTMGYLVAGVAALCMLVSVIIGGVAFRDYFRPHYGFALVILALCAVGFALTGQAVYDAIPTITITVKA